LERLTPLDPSLEPVLRDLLARAFRSTLHRLRGLRALLGGWIECGVPPGAESRVPLRLEEDMILLARLDWIGSMLHHPQPLKLLESGEAPSVLLAAALGLGTPEEARERLPRVPDPEMAVALALALQILAPNGTLERDLSLRWEDHHLVVESEKRRPADLSAWRAAFERWSLDIDGQRIVLRPAELQVRQIEFGAEPRG
jgi:hypothetical protein